MSKLSRVLVAGGAGFIGSHIADRLLDQDIAVTVLDNLYTGRMENIEHRKGNRKFRFVRGNVKNFNLVKRLVKNVDAVFNEAAVVSVPRSLENPLLANEVNVGGTLNLLKASLDSGVKRFVQASSASVYGNTETLPVDETLAPNPVSPYAVAELAAENYAKVFWRAYGLETVCLRYFNVYGPRQIFSVYSGATTIFLNTLLQDQHPIIFGDGNQTRDFVYVEDVVEANMLALNTEKAVGETCNIATGTPHTINELIQKIREKLGKQLKPIYKNPRQGDIRDSYASIEKAKRMLGYKPKFSLEKGITKLVKYYQKENTKQVL
ncbi:MAG TPA: SDR family oxidoreductase [candidate division Zixibacteria bacterium]|nr:SDR family oxidoreductase [candidate division Zixibacteria bacterium]